MLSALIATFIALFAFIGAVSSDAASPALQDAQDKVVAALSAGNPPNENSSSNSAGENGQNDIGDVIIVDENGDPAEPDITKVTAYNTAAGFVLPTEVPKVAVGSPLVLILCEEVGAECPTIFPTEEGSENSSHGSVGLDKAAEAKLHKP